MKIKEVETRLNLSRANIRFYERQGLLKPARQENRYRDYDEEDIRALKRVIVLRKCGVPVADIKSLMEGALSMDAVLVRQTRTLEEQLKELNGALKLCHQMEQDNITFEGMDEEHYLSCIADSEAQGSRYLDIAKDYLDFELEVLGAATGTDLKEKRRDSGPMSAALVLVLFVLLGGLVKAFWGYGFGEGAVHWILVLAIVSLIALPVFVLRRTGHETAASRYRKVVFGIAVLVLAFFVGLLIVSLLNARFHFWF